MVNGEDHGWSTALRLLNKINNQFHVCRWWVEILMDLSSLVVDFNKKKMISGCDSDSSSHEINLYISFTPYQR